MCRKKNLATKLQPLELSLREKRDSESRHKASRHTSSVFGSWERRRHCSSSVSFSFYYIDLRHIHLAQNLKPNPRQCPDD
ncbi:uncharacterized [Tachysurus ichikawai]